MWLSKLRSILSVVICGIVCSTECAPEEGKTLEPIFWNSSNPLFKSNLEHKTHQQIDAAINDKLDIICPQKRPDLQEDLFYFKLYLVSKNNFHNCNTTVGRRLLTCNVPNKEKKYTFFFQKISPSPWGLEFEPGTSYYVISTSDGSEKGINSRQGGVCTRYNMRLELRIHEAEFPTSPIDDYVTLDKDTDYTPRGSDNEKNIPDNSKNEDPVRTDKLPNKDEMSNRNQNEAANKVSGNGLIIGAVLGACGVLFIVLLAFLGYKVHRKHHQNKKYSPPITPTRGSISHQQVTLLPIAQTNHHQHHHSRFDSDCERLYSATSRGDTRRPPSYNESYLENGGTVACV